jgi:hypothetical protein
MAGLRCSPSIADAAFPGANGKIAFDAIDPDCPLTRADCEDRLRAQVKRLMGPTAATRRLRLPAG